MKISVEVLYTVACAAVETELVADKFTNAVFAWAHREKKSVTVSTKGHEATKENGPRVSGTVSTKVDKHCSVDGRSIHWLGINAELLTFGWQKPEVPEEVRAWLEKFAPEK